MSIFHCSVKIIGRSKGRSAVAAAAYRSGSSLTDEETGTIHNYNNKGGVIASGIVLPPNAPKEYADRAILWNEVQKIEKKSDAQLAREVEVAFPKEMTREQQFECLEKYLTENFVSKGMIADWAVHDKGDGNPHAHIMLTVRGLDEKGKWIAKQKQVYLLDENGEKIPQIDPKTGKQKIRHREGKGDEKMWKRTTVAANDWNNSGNVEMWRESWEKCCNSYLPENDKIDHRSYERQGLDVEPTIHEGVGARQIEKEGGTADRCEINRVIRAENKQRILLREKLKQIAKEITELIIEKAREIIGRFNKLRRNSGDIEKAGGNVDSYGATAGGSRNIERGKSTIKVIESEIGDAEQDIERTNTYIEGLKNLINERVKSRDERLRKLQARRGTAGLVGGVADGKRGAESRETEELIGEIKAAIGIVRSEADNRGIEQRKRLIDIGKSQDERAYREYEQRRLEAERAEQERAAAERKRRNNFEL